MPGVLAYIAEPVPPRRHPRSRQGWPMTQLAVLALLIIVPLLMLLTMQR